MISYLCQGKTKVSFGGLRLAAKNYHRRQPPEKTGKAGFFPWGHLAERAAFRQGLAVLPFCGKRLDIIPCDDSYIL